MGVYPERFPPRMRVAALVRIVLLVIIMYEVLIHSEYFEISKTAIWFVVVFYGFGVVFNAITPSKKERMLWVPVTVVLLASSFIVAVS